MWRVLPTHNGSCMLQAAGALLLYYALLSTYRAIVRIDFIGSDSGESNHAVFGNNCSRRAIKVDRPRFSLPSSSNNETYYFRSISIVDKEKDKKVTFLVINSEGTQINLLEINYLIRSIIGL